MKKKYHLSFFIILFSFIVVLAGSSYVEAAGLRYSIMVSKFKNKSNWKGQWNLGDAWGAILTDSLNQTGKFIVIGEKDMRRESLDEQDFAASGRAAGGGKKVVVGQMTPAQLLIKGDITHFEPGTSGGGGGFGFKGFKVGLKSGTAEINAIMYIVDSSTGQVIASRKCYGKVSKKGLTFGMDKDGFVGDIGGFKKTNSGKAIEMAVDEGVKFLISKTEDIPWSGTVILTKGKKVFINRGEREGVSSGQMFDVGRATVLRDPDTGEVLDTSLQKRGAIKVTKVKQKISICTLVSGSGIKKGMSVGLPE